MSEKYAGADWVTETFHCTMSPLGQEVADILGQAWRGIYHIHGQASRVDWKNNHFIEITLQGSLNSWDDDLLTRLLVLCNDRLVRMEISPRAPGWYRLRFHQRMNRHGQLYERLPYLEDHIRQIRNSIGLPIMAGLDDEAKNV